MRGEQMIERMLALPGLGVLLVLAPLLASASEAASPEARWNAVVACAQRADERQRHACVDEVLRDAGVLTPEQKQREERQRFGRVTTPAATPEPEALEVTIAAAAEGRDGRWTFTTQDGTVWRQSESRSFPVTPVAGQKLTVHKATLGSFLCLIDGKFPFRCARSR
jgi:hypothetical protein